MKNAQSVLIKEGGITFLGNLFDKFFRYLFLATVTYFISPSVFGEFVFAVSALSLTYGIFNTNFYRYISYYFPKKIDEGGKFNPIPILLTISTISFIAVSLAGAGTILFSEYLINILDVDTNPTLFIILTPLLLLYLIRDIQKEIFRAYEKVRYNVYINSICFPILRFLFTIVLLLYAVDVMSLVLGVMASLVTSLLLGLFLLRLIMAEQDLGGDIYISSDGPSFWEILNYSLPLSITGVVSTGITYVDIILLGVLADSSAPALFRIAFSVAALSKIASQMFKSISKPLYSRLGESENSNLSDFYLTTSRWNAIITIPVAAFLIISSEQLIATLFDSGYYNAAPAVPIIIIGMAFTKVWGNPQQLLEASGNTRQLFYRSSCILLTNIILDIILIPQFGVLGAAVGTSVALIIGTIVSLYFVKMEIGKFPITKYHTIYLTSGIGSIILCYYTVSFQNQILSITLYPVAIGISYISLLLAFKGFSSEDVAIVDESINRIEKRTGFSLNTLQQILEKRSR